MIDNELSRIRAFLKRPRVTKMLVATAAGINRNTLDGVEREDWDPKISTLRKVSAAVDRLESAING